ncbi:MAG TPA: acetylxylan esterase [Verrucomicrobiales bacterium]|nr:acetylxylan esterase [Verrucomicrobiales bacterium]
MKTFIPVDRKKSIHLKIGILLFLLIIAVNHVSGAGVNSIIAKTSALQKSKAGQTYQWSEAEGKEFLRHLRQSITTPEAWKKRADQVASQILQGSDLNPLPDKCPLNPIYGEKRFFAGYQVVNVAFESLPGVYVTGSVYSPTYVKGELPGILSPHGHWPRKEDYGRYRPDVQKRCVAMARMGAIVFSYDMVGYGQLVEFGWRHKHPQTMKLQIWNAIRAIDFMLTLDINPERIAVTGASGGGTQTFHIAAVDPRIHVSVPVVMVSYRHFGGCVCELGMPIHETKDFRTNNVEITACIAPNPLLLVSVGTDATETTPEVEYPFIKYIYGLFGKSEMVENAHLPNDRHGYDYNKRAAVYPFLAKHLDLDLSKVMNPDGTLNEGGIVIEKTKDLYPFDDKHPFPDKAVRNNNDIVWDWRKGLK